jgi:hypothetical protein
LKWQLSRSRCRPLLDLLLFAEKIVDFGAMARSW